MAVLLENNAEGALAADIDAVQTTITLETGQGAVFPAPTGGDWCPVTLHDLQDNLEIVHCTARSNDTLTVIRGAEGTAAQPWLAGDGAELRLTKAALAQGPGSDLDADTLDGKHASAFQEHILTQPDGLCFDPPGSDWNNAIASGFYDGSGITNQTPYKAHSWQYTLVMEHGGSGYGLQLAKGFDTNDPFSYRVRNAGTWQTWKRLWGEDNLPIQQSPTDGATGTALLAGAFGIGGVGPVATSLFGSNFNANVPQSGNYTVTGTWTNGPFGGSASYTGILRHVRRDYSSNITFQEYIHNNGDTYQRVGSQGGSWYAWEKVHEAGRATGWNYPTLLNGWQNYGTSFNSASYRRDAEGYVYIAGLVRNGTPGTHIFRLPSGFRPAINNIYLCITSSSAAVTRVDVRADGYVTQTAAEATSWIAIDCIPGFIAEL